MAERERELVPVATRLLTRSDVEALEAHVVAVRRWRPRLVAQDEHIEELDPVPPSTERLEEEQPRELKFEDLEVADEPHQPVLEHLAA